MWVDAEWKKEHYPFTCMIKTWGYVLPYLNEHLAQEGHDKGGVHATEASDRTDGQLPDLKHFIVQRHKQRLQVLGLGEVSVEALVE